MTTTTKTWKPIFTNRNEKKAQFDIETISTCSSSNQIGFIVTDDVQQESPACFWVSSKEVYLRMNWRLWYRVSVQDKFVVNKIGRRPVITLYLSINNNVKETPIPVYPIDQLPQGLFDGYHQKTDCKEPDSVQPDSETSYTDICNMFYFETSKTDHAESSILKDLTLRYQNVCPFKYNNKEYRLLYIDGHLLLLGAFEQKGEWLADEEVFNGEAPFWYSESRHLISPVHQVSEIRKKIENNTKIKLYPIILFNDDLTIINGDEIASIWENLNVNCCYQKKIDSENCIGNFNSVLNQLNSSEEEHPTELSDFEKIRYYIETEYENYE